MQKHLETVNNSNLRVAAYYAPRGRKRLYQLGSELAQRYLYASDLLIGIIGTEGAGKSTLIRGLFPGLELTNDDDGVNIRPTPIYGFSENDFFAPHSFHIDIRYELAFHQVSEITEAICKAIKNNRRVVVEHFDLIYKQLGFNAQIIFAIGEEVKVYRPSVFGPSPLIIKDEVEATVKYRLMAHSAEDIVFHILSKDYHYTPPILHSDVRHGFVIAFLEEPKINLEELEQKARTVILQNLQIVPTGGDYILLGEEKVYCTGKRIHVKETGQIENFRLLKSYLHDPIADQYLLVGIVGREKIFGFNELEKNYANNYCY